MGYINPAVESVGKEVLIIQGNKVIGRGKTISARGDEYVSVKFEKELAKQLMPELDDDIMDILNTVSHARFFPITGTFRQFTVDFEDQHPQLEERFEEIRIVDEFNFEYGMVPDSFKDVEGYRSKLKDICEANYSVEQLRSASGMARHLAAAGRPIKGVITVEEADERARHHGTFMMVSCMKHRLMFFTDDYCIGANNNLPEDFVPSSTTLPYQIAPRESCPSGYISSVQEYIRVCRPEYVVITTIEELVSFLNANYVRNMPKLNEEV